MQCAVLQLLPMANAPQYLTGPQVARQLGVNPSTVYRWATDGRLTVASVAGTTRLFTQDEVDRFVREARV